VHRRGEAKSLALCEVPAPALDLESLSDSCTGGFAPPATLLVPLAASGSKKNGRGRVQMFQDDEQLNNRLLAGCDPGMSVLARHAQRAGVELVLAHRNSPQALSAAEAGMRSYCVCDRCFLEAVRVDES